MVRISPSTKSHCVYMLGDFHIEYKAQPIRLPTRKTEALLAYLILHPGAHTREKIAALFWGDSSDTAARVSLRKALTLLRKNINDELVIADRENVQLNSSFPLWVDVYHIENLAKELLSDPSPDLHRFNEIVYLGDLLSNLYDDWVLPLREHYRKLYLDILLRGVEQARAQSEYQFAIEIAQNILSIDIARERAHQHLMFCYMTLGDHNKALRQYDACQRALQKELAVEPADETRALYEWIKQADSDVHSLAARITNLPIPISSFVGRSRELSKIKQLVLNHRLVTLTGAGGSGKTRLAIHATTDLIDSFKDGVWWVELAPLSDAALLPSAVAKALGISNQSDQTVIETLVRYLHNRKALLVLDNCEHLIDACAQLTEQLLNSCANLEILVTSREALGLIGEHVWQVPTMSLPAVQSITLADLLMQYEGISLFVERASAVRRNFTLDEMNASIIAQICQQLDGIPLAIELAAARIKTISLEQIAERLDDRFQLLTATNRSTQSRHQTLRAAIDWSYELLLEDERQLFCRLSIFSGGWTLEAAEAICSGEGIGNKEILELLAHLVDKSLVINTTNGQRYMMLETIRQYAREKLMEIGLEDLLIQKHLDYFLHLAETADGKIRGREQLDWIKRLEDERGNLTVALKRAVTTPSKLEIGCNLTSALCWYWYAVGDFIQIRHWLESVFSQSEVLGRTATRAKVLLSAGAYSAMRVQWLKPVEACAALEESLEIWRELGSAYLPETGKSLLYLGYTKMIYSFKDTKGIDHIRESIEIFKELKNYWWQAWALGLYEMNVWSNIDYETHRNIHEQIKSLWEQVGDRHGQANVLFDMGMLEQDYGKFAESEEYLKKSLEIFTEFKAKGFIQSVLVYLGNAALALGRYEKAQEYYEEDLRIAYEIGQPVPVSNAYHSLGHTTLFMGNDQRAEEYFYQVLKFDQENNHEINSVFGLMNFACLATTRKNPVTAARLFGAFYANIEVLQSERDPVRSLIEPIDQLEIDHYLALCRAQVDETEFERAWNEGKSLSVEDGLSEILKKEA